MSSSRQYSLELKLPVFITGIIALVVVTLALLAVREVRRLALERAEARLLSVSQQFANVSAEGTLRRTSSLSNLASKPEIIAALRNPAPATLASARATLALFPSDSTVLGLRLRNAADAEVVGTGDTLALRALHAPLPATDSLTNVSEFVRLGDTIAYATSARIMDDGRAIGRLIQWRRVVLTPQVRDAFRRFIGSNAELYFGNRSGSLWYGLDGKITAGPPADSAPGQVVRWERPDAGEQLAIVRPLSTTPWAMAAEIPVSQVMSQPRTFLRRFAVIAALLLVLGGLLAILVSRRITRPLKELTLAAERMAAGDYNSAVDDLGNDEVGRLARSFRILSLRVQDTYRQLEADVADRQQEVRSTYEKLEAALESRPPALPSGE